MICECFYGFYIRIKLPRVTFSFKWFRNRTSHFWICPRDFSIWPIRGPFFVFIIGISRLDFRTADFPKTVRTSDRDRCRAPLRSPSRPSLCCVPFDILCRDSTGESFCTRFLLLFRRSRYCFKSGVVISRPRRASIGIEPIFYIHFWAEFSGTFLRPGVRIVSPLVVGLFRVSGKLWITVIKWL